MKVLKAFTEKGSTKRWLVGETYTGTRGKELAAKGLLGETEKVEPIEVTPEQYEKVVSRLGAAKEKVEVKPEYKNVVATISTQKVNRKK